MCQTPDFTEFGRAIVDSQGSVTVESGFIMDDVQQLRRLSNLSFASFKPFSYIPDPRIFPFDQPVVYKENMKLEIMVCILCAVNYALKLKLNNFILQFFFVIGATKIVCLSDAEIICIDLYFILYST